MTAAVTVVIPTLGRPSLLRAVRSAIAQTYPVREIIIVADTEKQVNLPSDNRISLLRTEFRSGPARSRQLGIDAATGSVIALLDDDDEWHTTKLERQMLEIGTGDHARWIVSCRTAVLGPGTKQRIWPRRLIEPGQSVADYLFRFTDFRVGGAELQTSTLCFPTELARTVPWDAHAGAAHDEASWIIQVQRRFPDLRVIHLTDVLSTYNVHHDSVSRDSADDTDEYIEWGLEYLREESPRVLGDYLATSPVSAAVGADSLRGVARSLSAALRHGRPGPFALAYATLNGVRIVLGVS